MSEAPERSEHLLRKIFYEIVEGCTKTSYEKAAVFLKHFSYKEQGILELAYDDAFAKAKKEGLDPEKECYEFLRKEGLWTAEEELELSQLKDFWDGLLATRKKTIIPAQLKNLDTDIEETGEKIEKIEAKKRSLLPETCESYAQKKSNDLMIYHSYYKDEGCTERLFSWEEYCAIPKAEIGALFKVYNEAMLHLSIDNIKYVANSNFFGLYSTVLGSKNMHNFLNKPMQDHTFYQLHLLNYAKILSSILENVQNIPDHFKDDPDKLIDYASASSKGEKMRERSAEGQGYSVVGATKAEMADMGVVDPGAIDIHTLAKQKGGTLTMEDFAKLS